MPFLDEKIALLEKANRRIKKEEVQKELKSEEKELVQEPLLTLAEMRAQIQSGEVKLKNQTLIIEKKSYFENKLVMPIITEFFDEVKEEKDTLLLVNNEDGLSLLCTYLPQEMKAQSNQEIKKEMEKNAFKMGLYTECIKEESLENLSYICSHTPTGKGWIYNILFRIHKKERRIVGNLNCLENDKDTYGLLLEAIVHEINELI